MTQTWGFFLSGTFLAFSLSSFFALAPLLRLCVCPRQGEKMNNPKLGFFLSGFSGWGFSFPHSGLFGGCPMFAPSANVGFFPFRHFSGISGLPPFLLFCPVIRHRRWEKELKSSFVAYLQKKCRRRTSTVVWFWVSKSLRLMDRWGVRVCHFPRSPFRAFLLSPPIGDRKTR